MYYEDIYRFILSYTLNSSEAYDLLQDTFIKYYIHMNKLPKDNIQIKKWLFRVANNNCKNHLKNFWTSNVVKIDYNQMNNSLVDKIDMDFEDILGKLEKKYRIPIYLYYYEGYKIDEIANILKINVSTIKMRLKKAREILKKEMEKEYEKI